MTTQTTLALLSDTLSIPGARIARRHLAIDEATPTKELPAIGHRIVAVRGFSKWALGDLMGVMILRGAPNDGGSAKQADASTGDTGGESWAASWADVAGLDPKERRELLGVSVFWPVRERTRELSWEHYREAMWGVADGSGNQLGRACDYLDAAVDSDWSATELRRHIRETQATEQPEPSQEKLIGYSCVFEFRRFASRELQCVASITSERARLLLDDIGSETLTFIEALKMKASRATRDDNAN